MLRLGGIQQAADRGTNPFFQNLESCLSMELEEVLRQEEMLWHQKSCNQGIQCGDRNIKYFHTHAIINRNRIQTEGCKWAEEWCYDAGGLKSRVLNTFVVSTCLQILT